MEVSSLWNANDALWLRNAKLTSSSIPKMFFRIDTNIKPCVFKKKIHVAYGLDV